MADSSVSPAAAPGASPDLPPLKGRFMAVFAFGDVVAGVKDNAIAHFLLFYLTAVCGLSGTLTGLVLLVSLLVDAVADPFIGYLSDNTRSRWGRRHPFMLLSGVPLAVAFGLMFAAPRLESDWQLFVYATLTLLVVRFAHSAFSLPYAALGAEISRDYRERSMLGSFRYAFNIIGNLTAVTLGYVVYMGGGAGLLERGAYAPFGWTCAAIALAAGLVSAIGTLRLRGRMHAAPSAEPVTPRRFAAELAQVWRNPSFRALFLCVLTFWVAQGAASSLNLHLLKYFWALPPEVIQRLPYAHLAGLASGVVVATAALRLTEKHRVCLAALAVFCALQFTPVTLRLSGVLTDTGGGLYAVLYAVAFVAGWSVTCIGISFNAMMADSTDEHEHRFGSRREALYFSGITFSGKAAIGVGAQAAGFALDLIGFPRNVAALGEHPVIAADTLRHLGLMAGPGAAVIAALSVVMLSRYRLGSRRHAQIRAELAERRGA